MRSDKMAYLRYWDARDTAAIFVLPIYCLQIARKALHLNQQ